MKIAPAAEPLVFGEASELMGWYHAPAPAHARDLGIVICAPHGYDSLCIHWALRALAERLASQGMPTLRFDYHGTGDALGDDRLPGRVPAWLASVGAAIELLKQTSGVSRVALIGLRLGATLASFAASERADVAALVLYGPSLSGRTWVREQKALGLTRHPEDPIDDTGNPNDVLMAGWLVSEETSSALGKLEIAKLTKLPAKDVLILHREDFPLDERPQKHLTALGASVTATKTTGWVALMQDALTSKTPTQDFDTIAAWLTERAPVSTQPQKPLARTTGRLEGQEFFEEPVVFEKTLFGVLCVPRAASPEPPLVLFPNTAANHHIGPHRSCVELSRGLAARGIASFRFDLAGLGDSPPAEGRPQNGIYSLAATRDVEAAINWLNTRGYRNITLAGLCSGGYVAFHTAAKDRRVRGLVLINLQRFIWKEGDSLEIARRMSVPSASTYVQRALRLDTWTRLARGSVDLRLIGTALAARSIKKIKGRASEAVSRALGPAFEVNEVPRSFLQMLERGTRVLVVYGVNDGGRDELALHLGPEMRRLAGKANATLAYLSDSDHTLTTQAARDKLLELLTQAVGPGRSR